jgi:hypothetical protein
LETCLCEHNMVGHVDVCQLCGVLTDNHPGSPSQVDSKI